MQEMNLLDKFTDVYTTNQYVYKSNDSIETLRNKIKFLIDQEEILDFKYNLTGILRTDNSFQLVRKAGLGRIKSWDREPMTITGKSVPDGSKNTRIEMEIKPNFIFFVIFRIVWYYRRWGIIKLLAYSGREKQTGRSRIPFGISNYVDNGQLY